ncbi:CPBP family intramembrane glutamic endopeptidase [Plantactinospora soyae]|uniref:Membrane protease YdiL (CAAX protease family) n=1 Tax=Plantactinospora soyae TaxID=1544732 RepID=A0A927M431_9ACTN|nr:type II CAAX endopeptidase family protein [Plantactinospora soyae]MBE1486291.1 membrane protease YdiL (CAAX protease family) [Plantactinospora soyae]
MANLLSWIAWLPYILSSTGLGLLDFRFPSVLGTTQFAGVLPGAYLGPITAAFVVTAVTDGRAGLRRWVGRMLRWRIGWRWYLLVLTGVPGALILVSIAWSGGAIEMPPVTALVAYLPLLLIQMVTTGIAEEPGWRDFATPRLQRRYGALVGSMILGPLWGAWHLPLFLSEWGGWPDVTWLMVAEFVAGACALSVVLTWAFNRSGESLPLVMLLHVSVNTFLSVGWSAMFPSIATAQNASHVILLTSSAAALVVLVATRGRLGYQPVIEPKTPVTGPRPPATGPRPPAAGPETVEAEPETLFFSRNGLGEV